MIGWRKPGSALLWFVQPFDDACHFRFGIPEFGLAEGDEDGGPSYLLGEEVHRYGAGLNVLCDGGQFFEGRLIGQIRFHVVRFYG